LRTWRATGNAIQLDRPDPGAVAAAGGVRGVGGFSRRGPAAAGVSYPAGPGLHRVLRHHDIPLPALPVSALFVAADDGLQGLPAWLGAGRGGVRAADVDGLEEQRPRFRPADRELPGVLRALGRRSIDGGISTGRADDGRAVLVAGDAAARARCADFLNKARLDFSK
jgi:hypothetical protein